MNQVKFGISKNDLDKIIYVFKENSHIHQVKIFGSRALGNFKKGSDIDLSIKGEHIMDIISLIQTKLNEELPLPYKFDVLDYDSVSSELRDHIDQFGIEIYHL